MTLKEKKIFHLGLLAAMPEELGCIVDNLQSLKTIDYGDLKVFTGEWSNKLNTKILISVAWSGWGKVSCARATTRLLSSLSKEEKIDLLIFTGVAGAVDINLKQWDIVISEAVLQHDMDARPLFKKFVIPAINQSKIYADKEVIDRLYNCLIINIKNQINPIFGSINKGLIATGDKFISDKETLQNLSEEIPHLLAVEMEGAAFAQVATQEKVKWVIIRVISDNAGDEAYEDFNLFLQKYKFKSWELIKYFLDSF